MELRISTLRQMRRESMCTTWEDARFLRILIEASRARRGLEVGVFQGFGAIQMGIGFERNGGRLYCLEVDPQRAEESRANVAKARLERTVKVVTGDALQLIPKIRGKFDFVFLDAVKRDYLRYLRKVEPKLKAGAVVVADNVIRHEEEMKDFLRYVHQDPNYETVTIRASMEKNDGMTVSYKLR